MEEIFLEISRLCQAEETFALATVVRTEGSTPRKPGAKLLIRPDGSILDSLGGGCVEAEVWQEAMQAMGSGRSTVREFQLSDDLAAESGLLCGGTMEILINAVTSKENFLPIIRRIVSALRGKKSVVLATLLRTSKSSIPTGAKVLIEEDGCTLPNFSGMEFLEDMAKEIALHTPLTIEPRLVSVEGTDLFIEVFQSLNTLLIIGAGHIGKALYSVAKFLGFRVVVVDDREEFANSHRFPEADEVIAAPIVEAILKYPISHSTFVVVATRGHRLDYEAMRAVLNFPAGYVGMLGSKRKVTLFYQQLADEGFALEKLRHIHAPIGLNLGAMTPEEIALSIMAEIVMEKFGGDGKPLKLIPDALAKRKR